MIEQKSGVKVGAARSVVAAIEAQLRASQFEPSCDGKTVIIEFSFEFHHDLPAKDNTPDRIVFQGPNMFVIAAPPVVLKF